MLGVFSMRDAIRFPKNFLWGSATAGYQIEGDNVYCQLWHNEQSDPLYKKPGNSPSGRTCNFWELWKDDFSLLSKLGHQVFRMSVEWSRIEPEEGRRDQTSLDRYIAMFEELKRHNIKICLTLYHWTHPEWFEEKGEFFKKENNDCFLKHLEFLIPKIAQYVDFWIIFNEFNNGVEVKRYERKTNMLIAHARAAELIRQYSKAPISSAHAMSPYFPADPEDMFDVTRTRIANWVVNDFFYHAIRTGEVLFPYRDAVEVPGLKGSCDFWSINYYTRHFVTARTQSGFASRHPSHRIMPIPKDFYLEEFYPQGLVDGLCTLKDLPIYITENGFCCNDDRLRILYLGRHIQAMKEALDRGCDLRGYLYWSFLDNYEWDSYIPRFGLVDVDFKTFKRTPKQSAYFYKEVIERNGIDRDLLLKYLPEFKDWKIYTSNDNIL